MKIVVTGAGGFIGSALVERLSGIKHFPGRNDDNIEIIAVDAVKGPTSAPNVRHVVGDITDSAVQDEFLSSPVDLFFHLAAIPGGGTARNPERGWAVNIEATTAIFARLAAQQAAARMVFASSIGVFGVPLPADKVDDDTLILPSMSYGAHKQIGEILLADYARRGLIDGLSIRLPGIVARPRIEGGHQSAFMSDVFHALADGDDFICPVSEKAASWMMSRERCVDNLVLAASLGADKLPPRRVFNLPALRLTMADITEAMADHFGPQILGRVSYQPNAELEAQYGSYPPLFTPMAEGLGFKHDGNANTLVKRALSLGEAQREGA